MTSIRIAAYFGLTAALALTVARLLHVDLGGLWVVLIALTVFQAHREDALANARNQTLGATVGVFFGAVSGTLLQLPFNLILAVFVTAATACSIRFLRGAVNIACAGAAIVILLPVYNLPFVTALHRFVDTLLGAAIGVVVSTLAAVTENLWRRGDSNS